MIKSKILSQFSFDIKYHFSTREFGFSTPPYKSLNFGFHVGDKRSDVIKNHEMLYDYFDCHNSIVYMNQIHSNKVENVSESECSPIECDAIVTDKKKLALMVMSADCTPILLYDEKKKIVAAIHAGRAGAFQNIVKETLMLLEKKHKSNISDIYVVLGPSIHQCCYEVDENIYKEAESLDLLFALKRYKHSYFLDINTILVQQLIKCGVKDENIEVINSCTACNTEKFFSYRKEGVTGRMASVIMLL